LMAAWDGYRMPVGFRLILPKRHADDSSALNRGHEHQRAMRRWNARDGRPRCFGGAQRGSGT
jgi:hypothetical protein